MAGDAPVPHPPEWPVVQLRDIVSKVGSGATPTGGEDSYLPARDRFALVRSQNVFDRRFNSAGLAYISNAQADRLKNVILQPGDLLLNITGDGVTFSRCCMVPITVLPACVNQHVAIVRVDPTLANPGYVLSYLTHPVVKSYIESFNAGGSRRAITKGHIESFRLALPRLGEQCTIARILGALDDKIELNRRMNETLEAMVRGLFKSWFVDFDPVRAKVEGRDPGLPKELADLFPDSFEDSELGKSPKGWEVKRLSDLCCTQYGYTASATTEPVGPRFLRVMDVNKRNWIEWNDVPYCEISARKKGDYALNLGDVVVARMADPGKSAIIEEDVDSVFASYLVRLKTTSLALSYFIYGFLKSAAYAEYAKGAKTGSVQAGMNAKVIVGAEVVVPPNPLMEHHVKAVLPLRRRLVRNVRESQTLSIVRDTLLPKLISGELRVPDAERLATEAGV